MDTIYIHSDGALLHRAGRRLVLEKRGERRFSLPLKETGRVLSYGNAVISAHALETLLVAGIPLYYASRSSFGLRSKIVPATARHVAMRHAQYSICSSPAALDLAREFVRCKLRNMEALIFYLLRRESGSAEWRRNVREAQNALEHCRSGEEIMGTEGAAARHYFSILGGQLPAPFRFDTRSRCPATDPVNALLNLGYMTLMREAHTHLEIYDLDPYCGVLHTIQDGRPALALDFMEQFRQPLVDLFVLKMLRRGRLTPEDFQRADDGVRLTPSALKTFFDLYRKTMGDLDGKASGLRQTVDSRACALREHFLGQATYRGFELSVSDNIFAGE